MRLRFKITKEGRVRFISHLDYMRAVERALRRAKLPVAWTEGFNPHIRLSFACALSLGVSSRGEYAEVELSVPIEAGWAIERLNGVLPDEMKILAADVVDKAPKLAVLLTGAAYVARFACPDAPALKKALDDYNGRAEIAYNKKPSPSKPVKQINLKDYIPRVDISESDGVCSLSYACRVTPGGTVRAGDLLAALNGHFSLEIDSAAADIQRVDLYGENAKPLIEEGQI